MAKYHREGSTIYVEMEASDWPVEVQEYWRQLEDFDFSADSQTIHFTYEATAG